MHYKRRYYRLLHIPLWHRWVYNAPKPKQISACQLPGAATAFYSTWVLIVGCCVWLITKIKLSSFLQYTPQRQLQRLDPKNETFL